MEKFSVVIPTLWRCERIYKLLDDLELSKHIGEIILIDNANEYDKRITKKYDKIKVLAQETNIFVNPAWNLGVKNSTFNNICVTNDDINWDDYILPYVASQIDKGIIGQWSGNYDRTDRVKGLEVKKMAIREWGWGCLFFIKKNNWVNIPKEMKIAAGDDFLIDNVKGGAWMLKNHQIYYEQVSRTSIAGEFFQQQEEDIQFYNKLKDGK